MNVVPSYDFTRHHGSRLTATKVPYRYGNQTYHHTFRVRERAAATMMVRVRNNTGLWRVELNTPSNDTSRLTIQDVLTSIRLIQDPSVYSWHVRNRSIHTNPYCSKILHTVV